MNIYQYRAPSDSNVCSYFKTFPLSVWSHKHFVENTNILDFEQSTRLWYENLTTIRNLPNSLVSKEILDIITKRKMGDTFTLNKKKRKYAEDEVHTSSVGFSYIRFQYSRGNIAFLISLLTILGHDLR